MVYFFMGPGNAVVNTLFSKVEHHGFKSISRWIVYHYIQLDVAPSIPNGYLAPSAGNVKDSLGVVFATLFCYLYTVLK